MLKSRLKNTTERKAIHNILLVIFGFIIIIGTVVVFGAKLLVGFSLLIEKSQGGNDTNATNAQPNDASYIAPPTLNPAVDATNSAQIAITGFAQKDQTITLYVNDEIVDKTSVGYNNQFKFESVSLHQGQNAIKAKAGNDHNQKSDFSNTVSITYAKNPPKLTINKPQDGQGFSKGSSPTVSIEGNTDPDAKVTVNDSWAIVDDQGNFTYLYTLKDGDNDIKVVATDSAGNQTTKEFHIHTQ
jgi:bacillopeptidase F